MNAPFAMARLAVRQAALNEPDEREAIESFCARAGASLFQRPAWIAMIEAGTGQRAIGLVAERDGQIEGWLPLNEIHSPIFGRSLASSGFAIGGGICAADDRAAQRLADAAIELAGRLGCTQIDLRGGPAGEGWAIHTDSHCNFAATLCEDDEAQLLAIPRKQRAEIRKGLRNEFAVEIGHSARDREAHYAVYSESVRNLGTPVFPRELFEAALDLLDADILTLRHEGAPVASVLSFYHDGAVMPYWGGGTFAARRLRANDRMYFELMRHARERGCTSFDFGRSKTASGAYFYKKTWGFEPEPLTYASWTAPGFAPRDADPNSDAHSAKIELWKRLPLSVSRKFGPLIARGLG